MAQCPLCNAEISDEFGLIECPKCSAPLIVHMDGRVEFSGGNAPVGSQVTANAEAPAEVPAELPATDDAPAEFEFSSDEPPVDEPPAAEPPMDATQVITQEEPATEMYKPTAPTDSPDLSDIARFGNSDNSTARDGSLRYNLHITGIDTADVREAFREAITDRKLVWDIDQILRSIKNGEVRIPSVPALKAYILVSRLRNLPVQVSWEQYAISQS